MLFLEGIGAFDEGHYWHDLLVTQCVLATGVTEAINK